MEPSALWSHGWHRDAQRCESPNYGPRPEHAKIDLVVLHSISLPPGEFGTGKVQELFLNQLDWDAHPYFQSIRGLQVSAHFFIERTGRLWQFVSIGDRAWHAGASSYRGREHCNDDSVGIELEGLEGGDFSPAQYDAASALVLALAQALPVEHVAGHEHIAPGRKADPGAGWDWRKLQQNLTWPPRCFPPGVLD